MGNLQGPDSNQYRNTLPAKPPQPAGFGNHSHQNLGRGGPRTRGFGGRGGRGNYSGSAPRAGAGIGATSSLPTPVQINQSSTGEASAVNNLAQARRIQPEWSYEEVGQQQFSVRLKLGSYEVHHKGPFPSKRAARDRAAEDGVTYLKTVPIPAIGGLGPKNLDTGSASGSTNGGATPVVITDPEKENWVGLLQGGSMNTLLTTSWPRFS
jgi:hypothetical protein